MIIRNLGMVCLATVVLMTIAIYGYAQAPLGINYQGIARNMDGTPKSEQPISIRVSILDGGISGVVEYSEIHEVITNQFGLFALVIGQGEKIGDIQNIEWSTGDKWLQVEMDAEGGNNFEIIGAQQILSVPYAMYASQSGTELKGGDGISVNDDIIINTAPDQPVTLLGAGNVMVSGTYPDFIITGTDNIDDADNNPTNELQTLDQEGTNVTLSDNGGSISIEDADADPSNEIQDASQVAVTPGGNISSSDVQSALTELQGDIDQDADQDPSNEIQDLSTVPSGTDRTINITGGLGTTFSVADADNNPNNEIQNAGQVAVTPMGTLTSTDVQAALGELQGEIDVDVDTDPTNEIQDLSSSANGVERTINISGGMGTIINIEDPDSDPGNEIQTLSQIGSTITLSNGGGVVSINDADSDSSNELQDLSTVPSGTDRTINISGGTGTTFSVADTDNDPSNEIQNLSTVPSGTDRTINISGGLGTTFNVADADNNPNNEIQNAGQVAVTPTGTLTSTDVQAALNELQGEIDVDADTDPTNEIQTLSQVGSIVTISNGGGSVNIDDADSDPGNEIQDLQSVLAVNNNAGGNVITGLSDPVNQTDAVTKNYLEVKDATDYAFKTLINETSSGGTVIFDLSTYDFDEGPLISLSQIRILETGVYLFNVKGSSTANAPIVVNVNDSDDYPVGLINIGKYSDTILLKLNVDDIVELRATSTVGEVFALEFFGFKI